MKTEEYDIFLGKHMVFLENISRQKQMLFDQRKKLIELNSNDFKHRVKELSVLVDNKRMTESEAFNIIKEWLKG